MVLVDREASQNKDRNRIGHILPDSGRQTLRSTELAARLQNPATQSPSLAT